MVDILLAIVDFIPVGLFLAASIILQRDLYNTMSIGAFALFASGTILVFCVGALKAIHKLFYYAFNLNFYSLAALFFPMQTLGFVLAGAGLIAMISHKQGNTTMCVVPLLPLLISFKELPDDSGKLTMVFVVLMCLGVLIMYSILSYFAFKRKNYIPFVLLIVAFICTLGMGYLSTKEDLSDWYKEIINSAGQCCFLISTIMLHKKGLGEIDSLKPMNK